MDPKESITASCLLLGLAACGGQPEDGCISERSRAVGAGGNVAVVLLDDIGLDKVASYEAHPMPSKTPVLDGLGEVGLRFDQAFTSPSCSPTRASLLTGRRPHRHGIGDWIDARDEAATELSAEEWTLPEALADAGYTSALAGKWHLSAFDGEAALDPMRHGFAHHHGALGNITMAESPAKGGRSWWNWQKNVDGELSMSQVYSTIDTTDEALGLMRELPEPWFTLVAYNGAHSPWHTPPSSLHDVVAPADRYDKMDAMVQSIDTEVGRLLDGIDLQTTTVFVLSDNGTAEEVVRPPWSTARAKRTVHDAGVHVPMWAVGAEVDAVGERTSGLVHVTDLYSTVLAIAGVDAMTLDRTPDGTSFLPLLSDPGAEVRRCVVTEQFLGDPKRTRERSIRDGRFELVRSEDGKEQFFDLEGGPRGAEPALALDALDPDEEEAWAALGRELDRDDRKVARQRR